MCCSRFRWSGEWNPYAWAKTETRCRSCGERLRDLSSARWDSEPPSNRPAGRQDRAWSMTHQDVEPTVEQAKI